MTLFAAHAAGVAPIDTVYPAFKDLEGLAAYVARARRDGFAGMLAIHPTQVPVINAGFLRERRGNRPRPGCGGGLRGQPGGRRPGAGRQDDRSASPEARRAAAGDGGLSRREVRLRR